MAIGPTMYNIIRALPNPGAGAPAAPPAGAGPTTSHEAAVAERDAEARRRIRQDIIDAITHIPGVPPKGENRPNASGQSRELGHEGGFNFLV
jgi:hypothetical protein